MTGPRCGVVPFFDFFARTPASQGKKECKRKKNQKSKVWNRSVLTKKQIKETCCLTEKKSENPAFFFVFFSPSHFLNLIALDEFEKKNGKKYEDHAKTSANIVVKFGSFYWTLSHILLTS